MELRLWPKQKAALLSPANENLYGGAAGGGKSHLLRAASIVYSIWVPGLITYIFRRTFKELVSNHIHTPGGYPEMLRDFIKAKKVRWDKSNYLFEFDNGSIIQLAHSQWETDITTHQGAQIGFLGIDEATHFTEEMIRFIRSRVRLGGLEVPAEYRKLFPRILYCSNPGGVGHDYFKTQFVDHGEKLWQAPATDGGMTRKYISAKLADNYTLTRSDPGYADRLRGLGDSALVDAMLSGDWDIMMKGMFSDVWRPDVQVIHPFSIPKSWKIDRAHDWGSSAPGGNLYFAESDGSSFVDAQGEERIVPRGSLFVVGELYFADEKRKGLGLFPDEQAKRMLAFEFERFPNRVVKAGPADASIWTTDQSSDSIYDQFEAEGIFFIKSDKSPGSRVHGWQLSRQMLRATIDQNPEQKHLYITTDCPNLIRTLPMMQRDDKKIEDIDTQLEDHLCDILRYRILRLNQQVILKPVIGL
jgi:hypothetical protein